MTALDTRSLADLYVQLLNERRLDELHRVLAEDFVSHTRVGDIRGLDRFKALMEMLFEAFPDLWYVCDEFVTTEDRVVIRYHWASVQRAPFLGIPPTHKMVRGEGIELLHRQGDRLVEIWNYADIMGLAAQLQARAPLELEI